MGWLSKGAGSSEGQAFSGPENDLAAASPGDVNITRAISALPRSFIVHRVIRMRS